MKQLTLTKEIWRTYLPKGAANDPRNHAIDVTYPDGSVITRCGMVCRPEWTRKTELDHNALPMWRNCQVCTSLLRIDREAANAG